MHTQQMNPQVLLDRFWSDCYQHSDKNQTHQATQNLLSEFRKSLDSSSKTAAAIDMDDPLDAIIYYAEKEGYMEIAQLLSI